MRQVLLDLGERLYFNPRSPHGERRVQFTMRHSSATFQSTLPARGATSSTSGQCRPRAFQSTLPARGATSARTPGVRGSRDFNPRSPHGERRECLSTEILHGDISIHAPRTGSDTSCFNPLRLPFHFNPRSPHGERLRKVTILSIRIIGFAQKVYHKTVLLRISLAENAVILPEKPRNPVRTSLQKAGGLRFARAIRAARPYSISSPSGA